jgi:hypothetical protein
MKTLVACGVMLFANTRVCSAAQPAGRTLEREIAPGTVTVGAGARPELDAPAAPMNAAAMRPPPAPPEPSNLGALVNAFANAYAQAGSPRIAILYNRTFANNIAAWTTDARAAVHLPTAVAARQGFSGENLQWDFEEGFARPFAVAGVRLVDASLIMQAANRNQKSQPELHAAEINANELNANLEALRQHTDWLVEVLMLPEPKSPSGYLFRATLKSLADGRVLGSGVSTFDDLHFAPPRSKVAYDDVGYKFVAEEAPKPTLAEYAQAAAVKFLADVAPRLAPATRP